VTSPDGRFRIRRTAVGIAIVIALGAALSACGNSGAALARQACSHINRSIALLRESDDHSDPSRSAQLGQQAYIELRKALPIAALAAYNDGQWQALMTTVSESNRVPETTLVTALTAQCGQADQSPFNQPAPPPSIPPPAPVSS
jgi:hypothetical protein